MSATMNSLDSSSSTRRSAARRFATLSAVLALASLLMLTLLITEPGASRSASTGPSWIAMIDGWGTGALGLLATLIVPIAVGEGVCRVIEWRTGVRRGMLIWATTTLATAYLLSMVLAGALAPSARARDTQLRATPISAAPCVQTVGAGGDPVAAPAPEARADRDCRTVGPAQI